VTERTHAHTAPRTAVVWSVLRGEFDRRQGEGPLRVLDVGGGSGVFAVPIAELGHHVTVVDASADALATLERRASDAKVTGRVTGIQGDVDRLADVVPHAGYDLVLCHSVLEVVDDPDAAVATLAAAMRPDGRLSILVANRAATVLARALSGHVGDALHALTDPDGRWSDTDAVRRRFDSDDLTALLARQGLRAEQLHGVGVVADLVPGPVVDGVPGVAQTLRDLELAAAATPPYRDIATQVHALAALTGPAAPAA
jgi:S-adenosylmethionine-dependent methyltransferase